jgi:hypothetical protein
MYPMRPSTIETLRKIELLVKYKKEQDLMKIRIQENQEKFKSDNEKVRKLVEIYR